MRPWLVLLGTALLLVGGGAAAALILFPPPSSQQQATSDLVGHTTPPNSVGTFEFTGAAGRSGTVSVTWTATGKVNASLLVFATTGCAPSCTGTSLQSWNLTRSGAYTAHGSLGARYELTWATHGTGFANVSASSDVTWTVPTPIPPATIVAEVASGLLALVGAIGLFLGLFLRGGFRRPAPVVSRSAEDAAGVADATGPRTASPDDGSGPPRQGPPSRSA